MRLTNSLFISAILVSLALASLSFAAVPQTVNYQGYLKNTNGTPVGIATPVRFSLYSSNPSRNNPVWRESKSVTPSNGIYSTQLGSITPITAPFDVPYFLGVQFGADAEMSLQLLSSVPYALRAGVANSLSSGATVPGATPWVSTAATSFQATTNNAYLLNNSTPATITLPGNAAVGDVIKVNAQGTGGYTFSTANGQTISGAGIAADYSVWLPRAGSKIWRSLASSADGAKLFAVASGDNIWKSTDGGSSWAVSVGSTIQNWQSIASSSDGSKLIAAVNGGQIYTSVSSGETWTLREMVVSEGAVARSWQSVVSSSDGTKLVAVTNGASGQIWTSADSGATWTLQGITGNWKSIASSSDGSKLVAAVSGGLIWLSGNGGLNWASVGASNSWTAVATSADGTKNVAIDTSNLYTFDDKGGNWKQGPQLGAQYPIRTWDSLASSADGSVLVVNGYAGYYNPPSAVIFLSTDGGVSWSQPFAFGIDYSSNPRILSVALSADGTKVAAAQSNTDYIYISGKTIYSGNQYSSTELVYAGNGQWVVNNPATIGQGNVHTGNNALATGMFNAATGTNSVVSGGEGNVASGSNATVAGGLTNSAGIWATGATVSGGMYNIASGPFSTVAGGTSNSASGSSSTVAGGTSNSSVNAYSTVSGGANNTSSGSYSVVGGGNSNTSSGANAAIVGGYGNVSNGDTSTVGGGAYNTSSNYTSAVNGGNNNTASGEASTIGGGGANRASGKYGTVPGGYSNKAGGLYSFAAGRYAWVRDAIAAGNTTGDSGTFVLADSQAAGFQSTGPNQFLVRAAGGVGINTNSPAAGTSLDVNGNANISGVLTTVGNLGIGTSAPNRRLHLAQNGAVEMSLQVPDGLADWKTWNLLAGGGAVGTSPNLVFRVINDAGTVSNRDVLSLNSNGNVAVIGANNWDLNGTEGDFKVGTGSIRLKIGVPTGGGGAGDIAIKADGGQSHLSFIASGGTGIYSNTSRTAGVSLAAGGSAWSVVSDRAMKLDIDELDTKEILGRLAILPVYSWRYKTEVSGARHVGPMAQDFYAAFGLGDSDKTITTVDADGIALAAIKALKSENDAQRIEIDILKTRLDRLERLLGDSPS